MHDLGKLIAGRYRLVDILGQGGMATVYCAVDRVACRPVAVKIIKSEARGSSIMHTRFHREARAIAKLDHPGFARLLDWGIENGDPFMVMEMVKGESLSVVLRRHARLATHVALRVAIAVCERLEHAHARGIVHRDIKPGNIMVQNIDEGDIKLIDFGIAKQLVTESGSMAMTNPMALTAVGTMLGSPPYCAPEQLRGLPVDVRTDIYAVGVLLYRMVTGETPFPARHSLATACLQLSSAPEPPSAVFPFVDEELEALILRCMSPRKQDRVATATDLRAALTVIVARLEEGPVTIPMVGPDLHWLNELALVAATAAALGVTSAWLMLS